MLYTNETVPVQILSVLEFRWEKKIRSATPRPFHAISFRVNGNADFLYGEGGSLHVSDGDIMFVPKGAAYSMRHGDEHLYVVHFEVCSSLADADFESFHPHDRFMFEKLFKAMFTAWSGNRAGGKAEAAAVFYRIMSEIQKEQFDRRLESSSERLKNVLSFIQQNFTDSTLSVEVLSNIFGTSDTYFRRVFKESMGKTPVRYISDLRISYAKELLQSGYYTVGQISEKCGFSDSKYFSRVIKKNLAAPPSEFTV